MHQQARFNWFISYHLRLRDLTILRTETLREIAVIKYEVLKYILWLVHKQSYF